MATAPQPPRPPLPPPAPQSGSHVVAIALMVLALIILVSVVALWTGFRIISRSVHLQVNDAGGGKKEVSIKTPFGGIEVNKNKTVSEASLDLPFYPGATSVTDHDDASVNMQFGSHALRIVVAKFQTTDALDKVKDFYQDRLTREVGKFEPKDIEFDPGHWDNEEGNFMGKDKEGKTVFEIKKHDHVRVVALKENGDGTRIDLVRVSHGKEDTN
ncbi:MAG: hypothetical protein ACYDA9_04600 [Terriglobia bacterium]